jgi:hypothetical protein
MLADTSWTPETSLVDAPQESCIRDMCENYNADAEKAEALCSLGVPPALAQVLVEEDRQIGLRIFILDNSGSTAAYDGHRYETTVIDCNRWDETKHMDIDCEQTVRIDCNRWDEIKHMALEQAEWSAVMGTPCEFRLLNPGPLPLRDGVDFAKLNCSTQSETRTELFALRRMLDRVSPHGHTPIAERLAECHTRIKQDHAELVSRGQKVVVVLATDGCPTKKGSGGKSFVSDKREVVNCIKKLTTELPVFRVVRLTCDEDDVIQFYNALDSEIELNLEVLDDIEAEAKEIVANGNGWLTYTPMIHKIREGGTFMKLFDLLDERPLTAVETALLSQLLLRPAGEDSEAFRLKALAKGFSQDSERLLNVLEEYHKHAALVYNPVHRRMTKPLNIQAVGWKLLPPLSGARRAFAGLLDAITPQWPTYAYAEKKDAQKPSVRNVKFAHELGSNQSLHTPLPIDVARIRL